MILVKLALYTLGCKVNRYDTQLMEEALAASGYIIVRWGEAADIYLVNTCTVTARSDRKSRKAILEAHRMNPRAPIFVAGCYAVRCKSLLEALPGVAAAGAADDVLGALGAGPAGRRITRFTGRSRPFVMVQTGCNRFCSYCIVPHVRGRSRSRPPGDVAGEVSGLVEAGYREIVITGICLGDYTCEGKGLVSLLETLESIGGLGRIRLSSIEPDSISDELLELIAGSPKLCRHLHIPFQSGDEGVLAAMRRPYTASFYRDLIGRIRKRVPGAGISADIIVGFPGETEEAFRRTVELVREAVPVRVHIFPYSPREGTPAAAMGGRPPRDEVKKRRDLLRDATAEESFSFRSGFLGSTQDVLIEDHSGYTSNYIRVEVEGTEARTGELVPVRITEVTREVTRGVPAA